MRLFFALMLFTGTLGGVAEKCVELKNREFLKTIAAMAVVFPLVIALVKIFPEVAVDAAIPDTWPGLIASLAVNLLGNFWASHICPEWHFAPIGLVKELSRRVKSRISRKR